MLKVLQGRKWQVIFSIPALIVWQRFCLAQSNIEAPAQRDGAADQQIPAAIAELLGAVRARIAQFEAALKIRKTHDGTAAATKVSLHAFGNTEMTSPAAHRRTEPTGRFLCGCEWS
jgi:hypothetical protein